MSCFQRVMISSKKLGVTLSSLRNLVVSLIHLGFSCSPTKHSLFVLQTMRGTIVLAVNVVDIVITKDDQDGFLISKVGHKLNFKPRIWVISDINLGLMFSGPRKALISPKQSMFLICMGGTRMLHCKPISTPMDYYPSVSIAYDSDFANTVKYKQIVGKLIYLTITRPNISYYVRVVSQHECFKTQSLDGGYLHLTISE